MRRIGIIIPTAVDNQFFQARTGAFLQELALLGWAIGRNVQIDTRWATVNAAEIRRNADELIALKPDVILAFGTSTVSPLWQATRTVPIVFPVAIDPVAPPLSKACATRRQCHWVHDLRIQHWWEMAAIAQGDQPR